jgi:DNA-binding transcriptional regulator/RsmH inhibitor MraZ
VDVYRWAKKSKVFLPVNFRKTLEQEAMFLKMLSMRQYFIKLSPLQHQTRMAEAVQEAMKYYPEKGLSDRAVVVIQIAGAVFFAVIYVTQLAARAI